MLPGVFGWDPESRTPGPLDGVDIGEEAGGGGGEAVEAAFGDGVDELTFWSDILEDWKCFGLCWRSNVEMARGDRDSKYTAGWQRFIIFRQRLFIHLALEVKGAANASKQ